MAVKRLVKLLSDNGLSKEKGTYPVPFVVSRVLLLR